jgi:hypothetical protein
MAERYKKGDWKSGKGFLVENTPEGPLYKVENVWVSPLAYKAAENLAKRWGISEKVALSKMVEQFVAMNCTIDDRLSLYKENVLPELAKKNGNGSREDSGEKVWPK